MDGTEELEVKLVECGYCSYVFPVIPDDIDEIEYCPKCGKNCLRKGSDSNGIN